MVYENEQVQALFDKLATGCEKATEFMKNEFAVMRVGRANPRVLDRNKYFFILDICLDGNG